MERFEMEWEIGEYETEIYCSAITFVLLHLPWRVSLFADTPTSGLLAPALATSNRH